MCSIKVAVSFNWLNLEVKTAVQVRVLPSLHFLKTKKKGDDDGQRNVEKKSAEETIPRHKYNSRQKIWCDAYHYIRN